MSDWLEAERHVERAHDYYERGKWAEAETELREALSIDPNRADWHFNLGLTLEAAGRYRDAVEALREAHRLNPDDAQVLVLMGVNALRSDDPRGAVEALNAARRLDPERTEPFIHLIEAHARLGNHEEAEVAFYRAIEQEGDHALAYANMAESLMERKLFDRAIYCLREAAALDADLERVHSRLAHAYAQTGRHERARQLYLRELRNNPGDIDTLLDLGCLLVDMNRFAEAGEKFRRVLELESDNVDAHFYLGELAVRQQRFKEAIASLRLVLRLEPEYAEARRRLARLLVMQGELPEARRLLRRELRGFRAHADDFDAPVLRELGEMLLDVRLAREAVPVFQRLTELAPDDAAAWHSLSVAHFQSGDRLHGIDAARRALRLAPDHLAALHNLALALMHEGQWARAWSYLRRALAIDREDHALRRLRLALRVHRLARWVHAVAEKVLGRTA